MISLKKASIFKVALFFFSSLLIASPEDFLGILKSLGVVPQNSSLDKPVKTKRHSLPFLKYPILSADKPIGYLLLREKGEVEEFGISPFPERKLKIPTDFPRYPYFLNSHSTSTAILLDYLGLRGEEDRKSFVATINLFLEKCLCSQPGKPFIYDIAKGLRDFATYRKVNLKIEEIFKSDDEKKALSFYTNKVKHGEPLLVSFIYDKGGEKKELARERRIADSYVGLGYLKIDEDIFLILWDSRTEGFLAKNWNSTSSNIVIMSVKLE
ncbi:hypothetical protein H5T87_08725 [bacterium]|nr:hypothetical protein [bacterium]